MSWCGKKYTALTAALALFTLVGCPSRPARPDASGDVGVLKVYAQSPKGPVRLLPGRAYRLPRPQDFAFELEVAGTGPRFVRIEVETDGVRSVMYEERLAAPYNEYLDYVLRLDEAVPDTAVLTVVVEAPHMMSAVSDFPLVLIGAESPFWETATATRSR